MTQTHDAETVERVAKAAAFSIRQPNDVSRDADEYWEYTGGAAKHTWRVAIAAAISAMPPQDAAFKVVRNQEYAQEMLDAVDDFMAGKPLTGQQRELQEVVSKAGCYAAAAYDAHMPKSGGEYHAMTRAFLLALVDPLSPDLDYLRAVPEAGSVARHERQKSSH